MFVRTLHPFGKSPSRPSSRQRRAKALPGADPRPQVERLEDRTLLSAANQALVAQMYQDLLQRPADAAGLANWTAALDHGTSPAQIALNLAQSVEARALQVQSLYKQFLHRGADSAGLADFTQALASGQTLEQVAAALVASPEYYQNRGDGSDNGFLNALYQDALNRQVDASGAATYGQALAGATSRGQVAQAVFASIELRQDLVQNYYQNFLHRAADAAGLANWTGALQHGMRDEQVAAAIVGSAEYAQIVQSRSGSLQQTLLPDGGKPQDVLVVNTPSQPVPTAAQGTTAVTGNVGITGTPNVNVANSPTVQAQQSGPWTVGISGTPTVQVASSLGNPVFMRDVNNAVQPFQFKAIVSIDVGSPFGDISLPRVLGNKRLVIEYVSGLVSVPIGQKIQADLDTPVNGVLGIYFLTPTFDGTFSGQDRITFSQQLRVYADPNAVPFVEILRSDTTGQASVFVTVSGYLVDV